MVDAAYMYPFWEWVGGPWSLVKYGVQTLDTRAKNLNNTELLRQAQDPYVTFREAYLQNLEFKVNDGKATDNSQNELSDDVLKERKSTGKIAVFLTTQGNYYDKSYSYRKGAGGDRSLRASGGFRQFSLHLRPNSSKSCHQCGAVRHRRANASVVGKCESDY